MIVHPPALHLLAASIMAATPVDPSTCGASDLRCTGQANLDAARLATSSEQKARHLYRAHRAYLALADEGPAPQRFKDLCRAQQLIKQARRLRATRLRDRLATTAAETEAKLKATGVECQTRKRSDPPAPERVAAKTADLDPPPLLPAGPRTTTSAAPAPATTAEPPPTARNPPTTPSPLALAPSPPQLGTPDDGLMPVAPQSVETSAITAKPAGTQQPRPGRRLTIAGGVTLGLGLGLSGVAGLLGGQLHNTTQKARTLRESVDGLATPEQTATDKALTRDYERLAPATLTLALVGGVTVVVGAVLVGLGAHRLARVASRTALVPTPGGLAFHARF